MDYQGTAYLENNPNWHEGDSPWKAAQVSKMLSLHNIDPITIIEIGCGAGGIIANLASGMPNAKFLGVDVSPHAIRLAEIKTRGNLRFRCGDAFATDDRYELALSMDVMEHVEDCFDFLRKIREFSNFQIYHIPLDISVQSVLRPEKLIDARERIGHIHYFTKETAIALLNDTGHQVLDYFYTAAALERGSNSVKQRLAFWPRKLLAALSLDNAQRIFGGFSLLVLCGPKLSQSNEGVDVASGDC